MPGSRSSYPTIRQYPGRSGCFGRAEDYLLDRADIPPSPLADRCVHDTVWATVLTLAPHQSFTIGVAAYVTDRLDIAHTAWRRAAATGDTTAMNNLAVLLCERGDLVAAKEWFRKAADASETGAMVNLGLLWRERLIPLTVPAAPRSRNYR